MLKGAVSSANVDLATLAGVVQRHRFVKHNSLSIADWSMLTLTDDHQIYAAQLHMLILRYGQLCQGNTLWVCW
jgi:hypothetical protein